MLVVILNQPDSKQTIEVIEQNFSKTDVFELRLDYLKSIDDSQAVLTEVTVIYHKIKLHKKEVIFTLRAKAHGGQYKGDEDARLALHTKLAELKPDYIDLEDTVPLGHVAKLSKLFPQVKIIRSYHDFNFSSNVRLDLDKIWAVFNKLLITDGAHGVRHRMVSDTISLKLVFSANSSLDSLVILKFLNIINTEPKYALYKNNVTAHCMGELGLASRVLGKKFGNKFTYCIPNDVRYHSVPGTISPAPGIITIDDLLDIYDYTNINSETKIFALIGNPVINSVGHIFHNNHYQQNNVNAVYVKLLIQHNELDSFFTLIKELPFDGLSVTMPFKTAVIKYLDKNSDNFLTNLTKISAINTIRKINDKFYGINTDGYGAVKALIKTDAENVKAELEAKHILILGAGGAARGIIEEISQYNIARLVVINRSYRKALQLKQYYDLEIYDFNKLYNDNLYGLKKTVLSNKEKFDYIINTISYDVPLEEKRLLIKKINSIVNSYSSAKTIYMNINYHEENDKSISTCDLNCKVISGYNMYVEQAIKQIKYWLQ